MQHHQFSKQTLRITHAEDGKLPLPDRKTESQGKGHLCRKRRAVGIRSEVEELLHLIMMKRFFTVKLVLLLALNALSSPSPQVSQHGQPAAGSMSTPVPGATGGGLRRGRWREWRRGDPTLLNNLWKSKSTLGNAEVYIVVALLIGFITVVVGCWLSDNCWSPEPEHIVTIA